MNTTTNNTTILSATETAELFAGSALIEGGEVVMEDTLHNITETVEDIGGRPQYANFDVNGSRTRKWFLENVGPDMTGITTLDAALKLSGLDYNVIKVPVSYNINQGVKGQPPKFIKIPDKFAVVREDTREVLGIVGDRYNLLQNHQAFDFMENLVEMGATVETCSTFGPANARSFICMKTENMDILGDIFTPYFVLLNGFDGGQTVKISFINERIYCKNMLNRALKNAQNTISIRHSNKMMDRLETARAILTAEAQHTHALKEKAELLALKPMDENAFYLWATDLFPIAKIDDTPILSVGIRRQ